MERLVKKHIWSGDVSRHLREFSGKFFRQKTGCKGSEAGMALECLKTHKQARVAEAHKLGK